MPVAAAPQALVDVLTRADATIARVRASIAEQASQVSQVVVLTEDEWRIAMIVGIERHMVAVTRRVANKYNADMRHQLALNIEGAVGEAALAKYRGRYWNGTVGKFDTDDVGRLQVRTSRRADGDLILHDADPDDRRFVLLTGIMPEYVVRGWIWGRDGKRREWWKDPAGGRPAYFVPQSALRPLPPRH